MADHYHHDTMTQSLGHMMIHKLIIYLLLLSLSHGIFPFNISGSVGPILQVNAQDSFLILSFTLICQVFNWNCQNRLSYSIHQQFLY